MAHSTKHISWTRWAALALSASVLMFALASCQALSGSGASGGDSVKKWSLQVEQAYADLIGKQMQDALQVAADCAQTIAALEHQVESLCADPNAKDFSSKLADLQATHKQLIKDHKDQLTTSRTTLEQGQAWLEGLVAKEGGATSGAADAAGAADVAGATTDTDSTSDAARLLAQVRSANAGITAMQNLMDFEEGYLAAKAKLGAPPASPYVGDVKQYYEDTWASKADFTALNAPQCMTDFQKRYVNLWDIVGTFYYDAIERNNTSPLDVRSLNEIVDWAVANEAACLKQQSAVAARQYEYALELFANKVEPGSISVQMRTIDEIAPNLYHSLNSVADLTVCTAEVQDVILDVEVVGFSMVHSAKYTLEPGVNFIACKPSILSSLNSKDLETGRSTQINFKLTGTDGTVIEQQSAPVEILSLYDFNWENDEFGLTAQFDVLAWLQAGSAKVDEINRKATEYMGRWTDGELPEIYGYQYEENWYATLLQVAAIQRAISDSGVAYVNDNYSARADQHILTPERALERKQALCIESSLLLASCLLSAGMHPFIVIQPGHSQVAVETWADSGHYFLVETSTLPYDGIDEEGDLADAATYGELFPSYNGISWFPDAPEGSWNAYFDMVSDGSDSYGGVFVVDCYLQRIMNINGLES